MEKQKLEIEIPYRTMMKVVLFIGLIYLTVKAIGILFILYISLIFASTLRPVIHYARFFKIPKAIAILVIYLVVITLFATGISLIVPPIITEMTLFIKNIPTLVNQLVDRYTWLQTYIDRYQLQDYLRTVTTNMVTWLSNLSSGLLTNAWSITSGVVGSVFSFFLVLLLTFYILVGENRLEQTIVNLFPANYKKHVLPFLDSIQIKLGAWLRGQIALMFIVGILAYIGFSIIGIEYALPLAVIAGLLEVIPYLGPTIAAVIGIVVMLPSSPISALGVAIVSLIVQQLENYVIVPLVMKQAVGLDPLVVIISLSVGTKLFGILGGLLAVPCVVTVQLALSFYQHFEKEQELYAAKKKQEQELVTQAGGGGMELNLNDLLQRLHLRRKM